MDAKLKIQVIIGTVRQNRFSEKAARWIFQEAKKRPELDVELLDLKDYPLPFYDEPMSPAMLSQAGQDYSNEMAKTWAKKIAEGDGYIMTVAEYNHGYPAVLKNALDWVFNEWAKKPVGFVSYGSVAGARGVEQIRQVVIELNMVPLRAALQIPREIFAAASNLKPEDVSNPFEVLNEHKDKFLDELVWWSKTLKSARE